MDLRELITGRPRELPLRIEQTYREYPFFADSLALYSSFGSAAELLTSAVSSLFSLTRVALRGVVNTQSLSGLSSEKAIGSSAPLVVESSVNMPLTKDMLPERIEFDILPVSTMRLMHIRTLKELYPNTLAQLNGSTLDELYLIEL